MRNNFKDKTRNVRDRRKKIFNTDPSQVATYCLCDILLIFFNPFHPLSGISYFDVPNQFFHPPIRNPSRFSPKKRSRSLDQGDAPCVPRASAREREIDVLVPQVPGGTWIIGRSLHVRHGSAFAYVPRGGTGKGGREGEQRGGEQRKGIDKDLLDALP